MDSRELTALHSYLSQLALEQKRLVTALVENGRILPEDSVPLSTDSLPKQFEARLVEMREQRLKIDGRYAKNGSDRLLMEVLLKLLEAVENGDPKGALKCVGCEPSRGQLIARLAAIILPHLIWFSAVFFVSKRYTAWKAVQRAEAPTLPPTPGSP